MQYLEHPLSTGAPPKWASAWGEGRHGPWVEFEVSGISQRMRWIPPGRFSMGPGKGEKVFDWEAEGQREVVIDEGFWLFDTPCSQALWTAVMGSNPSHFQGEQQPVENVSWSDCRRFSETLNSIVPGLGAALPGEEQWEYACRARSKASRYGELDAIAWYGGNSGDRTHAVGEKEPNDWGLHDILGNVWEWCADRWDTRDKSDSADRVIRGGSWANDARTVRAAFRYWYGPALRYQILGFRCASSGREQLELPAGGAT